MHSLFQPPGLQCCEGQPALTRTGDWDQGGAREDSVVRSREDLEDAQKEEDTEGGRGCH